MVIDLSKAQKGFVDEVKKWGGKEILVCVQCGKCASVCPLSLTGLPFFIKKMIEAVTCGMREILIDDTSMWACQSCNRCVEICPQDVKPYEVLLALRRVALRELSLPGPTIEGLRMLYTHGHAVFPKGYEKNRTKVGLPEKPPSTLSYPDALNKYKELLRKTELGVVELFPM